MFIAKQISIKIFFLCIVFIQSSNIFAQDQHVVDSIKNILNTNPNDTTKLLANLNLGRNFHNINTELALEYYGTAEKIGKEILASSPSKEITESTLKNLAPIFYNIGLLNFYKKNNLDVSLLYFQEALTIYKKIGDETKTAWSYYQIAKSYYGQNNPELALKYYNISIEKFKKEDDKIGTSNAFNDMGLIYYAIKDYKNAQKYFNDALILKTDINDKYGIAFSNEYLGNIFYDNKDYDKALLYLNSALNLYTEIGTNQNTPYILLQLGWIFYNKDDYEQSQNNFKTSLNAYKELSDTLFMAFNNDNIALTYKKQNNFEKALLYYEEAYSLYKSIDENIKMGNALNNLGSIYYFELNDNSAALLAYDQSYQIFINESDSIKAVYSSKMLANIYTYTSNFNQALKYYNITLNLYNNNNKKSKANILFSIAEINQVQGHFIKSIELFEQSNNLYKQLNIPNKRLEGYIHIGYIYFNMGEFDIALSNYNKALLICEETNNMNMYNALLNNIGLVYDTKGDYKRAKEYYEESLEYSIKANYKEGLVMGYINIGKVEINYGNATNALKYFQKGLDVALNINSYMIPTVYNNISLAYIYLSEYRKAEEYLLKAYNINIAANNYPLQVAILINLGNVYVSINNNPKALDYFDKALKIALEIKSFEVIKLYVNIGDIYIRQGNTDKALELYTNGLNKSKEIDSNPAMIYCLNGIGRVNYVQTEYDSALVYFNNAYAIAEGIGDKTNMAESLLWLGGIQHINGNLDLALENYKKVFDMSLKLEMPRILATSNDYLGRIYYDMKEYDLSKEYTIRGLDLSNEVGDYEKIKSSLTMLKWIAIKNSNFKIADSCAVEIININSKNLISNFGVLSEDSQELFLKTIERDYMDFNSYALARQKDNPQIIDIVYNNSIINKGLLLKTSTAMRNSTLNSKNTNLISQYEEWITVKNEISQLLSIPEDKRGVNIHELEDKADKIETELVKYSTEFSDFKEIQKTKWQDIQKTLKPNEAAIEFVQFQIVDYWNKKIIDYIDTVAYCALIIKHDSKHPEMLGLFSENEIENFTKNTNKSNCSNYVTQLYGKRRGVNTLLSNNNYINYSDSLYSLIWSKTEPYLEGINTIYYSPTGLLHNISFSALSYNDSMLLSDKYKLIYLASTSELAQNKTVKDLSSFNVAIYGGLNYDADTSVMLVNASDYNVKENELFASRSITVSDSVRGNSWNYLTGTLQEAESINKMFKKNNISTTLYTANSGIEESFKSLAGRDSPEIIHLATHGFFFPDPKVTKQNKFELMETKQVFKSSDNPLIRSGLIMSGANNAWNNNKIPYGIDDGILTAYEVSSLDLYNTELVVLSACETGLGDIKGSEGVYGLQRSFKMAGVDNLIMSLWQVPDKETSEFMQLFYTNLLAKQSIGDSFRSAQKVMREKYDPYYWAAFVLIE